MSLTSLCSRLSVADKSKNLQVWVTSYTMYALVLCMSSLLHVSFMRIMMNMYNYNMHCTIYRYLNIHVQWYCWIIGVYSV